MPTTCGFPNCKFRSRYRGTDDTRHFYRVPKKPSVLRERWLEAIGRTEDTIVNQVCTGQGTSPVWLGVCCSHIALLGKWSQLIQKCFSILVVPLWRHCICCWMKEVSHCGLNFLISVVFPTKYGLRLVRVGTGIPQVGHLFTEEEINK